MVNQRMSEKEKIKELRKRKLKRAVIFTLLTAFLVRRCFVKHRNKRKEDDRNKE